MASPLELLPNTYRAFFGNFPSLTPIQKQLIQPILNGEDIILQASTGAGKTEAVLAPATEKLLTHRDHLTILYIVPTRALALDMLRRIKPIYHKLGLKSGIRTGDGKHFRQGKPHLLIMTPESLDVMLGSPNREDQYFLQKVQVIILDEVHVFLHHERGDQLAYLCQRMTVRSKRPLQMMALSATIDNPEEIVRLFNLKKPPFYSKQSTSRTLQPHWVHIEDEERELPQLFNDLYHQSSCRKLLVFANSRKKCEELYNILNQEGVFSKKIFIHYSNLSTRERKFIEAAFRDKKTCLCIATSTLELGIDMGDLDGVVLIGPPPSTMAFLQRIGRGNRRQPFMKFWGICYGHHAGMQLLRFLAFFGLAQEHQIEKSPKLESYSVLFQQILSCLYAKKILSQDSLSLLFKKESEDLPSILHEMLTTHWLKPSKQPGIYEGGWRYFASLKKRQIWSNFPMTGEEYDVILGYEKIAVLPLAMVRQLEVGDLFRLTGKVLKVLRIEEKRAAYEVLVEEVDEEASKELVWVGFGSPTSFEVAQKMEEILLGTFLPEGLFNRTKRLLEKEREKIARSFQQPCGIWTHRLANGMYRYETFLGSIGNYILYRLIESQLTSHIEGLSVNFDEMGLECNEWIPFGSLTIPSTDPQFQDWISSHRSLLKGSFAWNSWMHWLPQEYQIKEIASRLDDPRVLKAFQRYVSENQWLPLPSDFGDHDKTIANDSIELKGNPWSLEDEKKAWGLLAFPPLPVDERDSNLTAAQVQSYTAQKMCPRWARFEQLRLQIDSHPRFSEMNQGLHSRRQHRILFKKEVMEVLQAKARLYFETPALTWQQAVKTVISDKKPLFLADAKLKVEGATPQGPDLIYIQHQGSHICLEIWDIKFSPSISYGQKWKIAFYAHLLDSLIKSESFSLPVKVSPLGGSVYPSKNPEQPFEKAPFVLAPYTLWMPRLLTQWKTDSLRSSAAEDYAMEFSCTSCRYFSYCYQEMLHSQTLPNDGIVSRNIESNDFPKNTRHWYFIHDDHENFRWQCWEEGESIKEISIFRKDFLNETAFEQAVAAQLQKEWNHSVKEGKNPHILVYESTEWDHFQKKFQSTVLKSLWAMHTCWTSIQSVLQTHFIWPIHGRLTPAQVGACLGFTGSSPPPLSLYHQAPFSDAMFELCREIWNWALSHVKSRRVVVFEHHQNHPQSLMNDYLSIHRREIECRMHDILQFQKNSLAERVKQFRAIGPMRFNGANQRCYQFSIDIEAPVSKFRVGDFLKLSPVESSQIQQGFSVVLESYLPEEGRLSVRPLSQKASFSKHHLYALDEDATDWNAQKISQVLTRLKNPKLCPEVIQMLLGHTKSLAKASFGAASDDWAEQWYASKASAAQLNPLQKQALLLPFREKVGLIEGPPGTGKTHLLVWTVMALLAHAQSLQLPIKILVTAQTHHAIDQILTKIAKTLPTAGISEVSLCKYGRVDEAQFSQLGIRQIQRSEELDNSSCLILGATGFGVYQLLEGKNFPSLFDWVVFDESSQLLAPYAVLSLVFGKGQALFYGDTQQLPPILKGDYEGTSLNPRSILQELVSRYGPQNRLRLNETYRMNAEICKFASEQWYDRELKTAVAVQDQQLNLPHYPLFKDGLDDDLDPSHAMVIVQLDHQGSQHASLEEADWVAKAVQRLMKDYSISFDQIGIISPHRLQNNTILSALRKALPSSGRLPRVDTIERMQGSEFDIVIFSATVSDEKLVHSPFLKDERRFNVALTRARKKFIFVASRCFFQSFPKTEKELIAQMPFEKFSQIALLRHPCNPS